MRSSRSCWQWWGCAECQGKGDSEGRRRKLFFTLQGKIQTTISIGIVPLGLLPVTKPIVHQGLAPLSALWMSAGSAEMLDEKVHIFNLDISPAGVREVDKGWGEGFPMLDQLSRAGACSLPGPLISEPDPRCASRSKMFS